MGIFHLCIFIGGDIVKFKIHDNVKYVGPDTLLKGQVLYIIALDVYESKYYARVKKSAEHIHYKVSGDDIVAIK